MSQIEVGVEFGKCSLKRDEEGTIARSRKDENETVFEKKIRTGNLYFDEHRIDSNHIPFMLTPYSVNMCDFFQKLSTDWDLPLPRIIIFAIGETEDSFSEEYRQMSKKLVKGLIHALNTTEMWLCADGLNHGFSRDIGRAFENEVYRRNFLEKGVRKLHSVFPETALIGICQRHVLSFSNKFGICKSHENVKITEIEKDINRRFGYFIIVEDTTETGKGISNFILNFSQHVTNFGNPNADAMGHSKEDMKNIKTPVIVLLLQGKISQIDFILDHLKRKLPLVVFKGSGGLADILAYAYYQATSKPEGINIAEYTESVLKPQVSDKMHEVYQNFSDYKISQLTEKIFDCIRYSKSHDQEFLTVLDINDIEFKPYKLPRYLLKALFKSKASEALKEDHPMKNDLFLAMDWNSADVATEEVFSRDPTSRFQIDGETFFRALTKLHREEFVSLFINQGFLIHTYLDSANLLSLFQNSLSREFFRNVVWESVLGYGSNVEITRKFLDGKLIILIEELIGVPSMINSYELDWNCRAIYNDRTPQEAERKAMSILVLWAILSFRIRLVKTLWRHSEQPIHLALACSIVLKNLEAFVPDLSLKNEILKQSNEFSIMAASVMTLCYESVPCRALDLLNEKNRVWSHKALMEIAAFGRNKMFLAHPCCQKYLDGIFMGRIKIRDLPYGDITIPSWLKIILTSFLIFPMYLWIRFETPEVKNVSDSTSYRINSKENIKILKNRKNETVIRKRQNEISKDPGFFKKIYYVWSAPISKFWISQIFYLIFLFCFSIAVLWPGCGNVYFDFFACVWIASIIMDSIYHAYTLNAKYTSMPLVYKCLEISVMTVFLFCYIMCRLVWPITFINPYDAKVMLCVALLYFYYRLIFVALPISSELGPLLYRVSRMIAVDFTSYIRVTALIIISNGIAIHATIYPDFPLNWDLVRRAFYDAIISLFLTPAGHFGTPDMKCIRLMRGPHKISFIGTPENECKVGRYFKPDCPNPGVWPYIFGLQYLIILRLILVTLLFALFSNATNKLEEQGKYIWKYQRYALITNFANRLTLPPPLCIITFIYMMVEYVYRNMSKNVTKYILHSETHRKANNVDKLDENDFRYWKSLALRYCNRLKQEEETKMTTKKRMERINALASALNNQRKSLRELEGHLNELQLQIKNAHQYLEGTGLQASLRERLYAKIVPQIFSRISPYPNTMVLRFPVSNNHVPWQCTWTMYDPISYTMPKENFPDALRPLVDVDIQRLREIGGESFQLPNFNWNTVSLSPAGVSLDRQSWMTDKSKRVLKYVLDSEKLPRNPVGRTGLKGRGCLPRWGPNHYIYVVITRLNDPEISSKYLDVILVEESDALSLPGGYVHTGNRYEIIRSLFQCDQMWFVSENMVEFFYSLVKEAAPLRRKFIWNANKPSSKKDVSAEKVKLGYMDEEINTDQAWCEAEVWHFHYNVPNNIEASFKVNMRWYLLSEETLLHVPIGQAAIIHSIAKKMKALLEVL